MSLIVSEVYEALIEAGASDAKAKAAAGAIPVGAHLATKEDIAELRAELKEDIAELRAELKEDNAGLRAELKEDNAILRAELKEDNAGLKRDMAVLKFGYGPAILALLVKLAFFP